MNMNKVVNKTLVAMLAAIKDYCGGNAYCENCPMQRVTPNGGKYCRLDGRPHNWELYGLEDEMNGAEGEDE